MKKKLYFKKIMKKIDFSILPYSINLFRNKIYIGCSNSKIIIFNLETFEKNIIDTHLMEKIEFLDIFEEGSEFVVSNGTCLSKYLVVE